MGPTPETRQQKLQDIAEERLAEAWFSLHVAGLQEPVYISEICDRTVNPSFGHFDLSTSGPLVGRAGDALLKLWVKTGKTEHFVLLLDFQVSLGSLQFIGKSLDRFHHPLPTNCVLFHFEDGIYTSLTDAQGGSGPTSWPLAKATSAKAEKTSSYSALMQLANIDDCIQDALSTRAKMEAQINSWLSANSAQIELLDRQRKSEEALNSTRQAIAAEKRQLRALNRKKEEMIASLQARKRAVEEGRAAQSQSEIDKKNLEASSTKARTTSKAYLNDCKGQIRRICEDMLKIYPLEPIKNRPLNFSIRGLHLPNSVFDDTNRDEIAAALGFASSLTHMLSLYLSTPLPYPISPAASESTIEDPVSTGIAQRSFPLYPTNVAYKFDYGVFLLNKDIEILMDRSDLRVLDIRHTLPNLKYLLYVLTARTGEIPERKAGGIRGLLAMRSGPRSRQGSQDSFGSGRFSLSPLDGQVEVKKPPDENRFHAAPAGKLLNGQSQGSKQIS